MTNAQDQSTCVLLPLDGSKNSLEALATAQAIAEISCKTLHVLHVCEESYPQSDVLVHLGLPKKGVPGSTVDIALGDPSEQICARAAEEHIEFVVMSARGAGATADPVGRVATRILENTHTNVVIVPPHTRSRSTIKRILVPLDGTPSSADAVPAALEIARASRASVSVIHVPPTPEERVEATEPGSFALERKFDLKEERRLVGEFFERFVAHHAKPDDTMTIGLEIGSGHPADEIYSTARRLEVDLIVAGWHGDISKGRAEVLRSVIPSVECPVLAVKVEAHLPSSKLLLAQ